MCSTSNYCEINDCYEHVDENIEYVLENVPSEDGNYDENEDDRKLKELFNTVLVNKCDCSKGNQQCSTCLHSANYILDKNFQELVLNGSKNIPDLIYECTYMCHCLPEYCLNRLVQHGPRKYLKIIDSTVYNSKGLTTTRDIPRGAFICEYAGELLTKQKAELILRENEINHKMNYVLCLKEYCSTASTDDKNNNMNGLLTIVNPSRKGNIGRYLNHSCDPNCQIVSVRIDCPIPKVAIFSRRFIKAGEELCFHYNEGLKSLEINNRIPCLCGTDNCEKYLPNSDCP